MKLWTPTAAVSLLILATLCAGPVLAQRVFRPVPDVRDALHSFEVTLTVVQGTQGMELRRSPRAAPTAACRQGQPCKWTLDERGTVVKEPQSAGLVTGVHFIVEPRKGGVRLQCPRGCMWPVAWFPCEPSRACTFTVSEFGVRAPGPSPEAALFQQKIRALARRLASERKPNFTGRWVLSSRIDPGASVPHVLVVRQWLQNANGSQRGVLVARILQVERRFASAVVSDRYEMEGPEGGVSGGVSENGQGPDFMSSYSNHWEGDAFVIASSTATRTPGSDWSRAEHIEWWSFDRLHQLVITTTDRVSGGEPKTLAATYRKR